MIVVDASALVDWLLGTPTRGPEAGRHIAGAKILHTLDMAQVEVISAVRRKVARGDLDAGRAEQAMSDLRAARLMRHAAWPLGPRIWDLRATHSSYDAGYVALSEALALPLVTTDRPLARSHGHAAEIVYAG